jgi:hypothetical protein
VESAYSSARAQSASRAFFRARMREGRDDYSSPGTTSPPPCSSQSRPDAHGDDADAFMQLPTRPRAEQCGGNNQDPHEPRRRLSYIKRTTAHVRRR